MMEENKLIEWFQKYQSKILLLVCCLVAIGFFAGRWNSSKHSQSKQDYLVIRQLFDKLQSGELLSLESMTTAEAILSHHPELHPKYDSLLVLSFFQQDNHAKGITYADATLKRAKKLIDSPYQAYGNTSLLIETGDYANALVHTQALDQALQEHPEYDILRTFNTLRLAFLAKTLHQDDLAKQAWDKAQNLTSFQEIASLFEEGTYSLQNFFS